MTDLERRVKEALERLKDQHAPQPQQAPQPERRTRIIPLDRIDRPRREPARPITPRPAAPKVWGSASKTGRELEGRFADAPDTHKGGTVRVFVFDTETIDGTVWATCVRQDNRQRVLLPIETLANVGDNA